MKTREQLQAPDENEEEEESVSATNLDDDVPHPIIGSYRLKPSALNIRYIELIDKARFRKWENEQRKFQTKARKAYQTTVDTYEEILNEMTQDYIELKNKTTNLEIQVAFVNNFISKTDDNGHIFKAQFAEMQRRTQSLISN